MPVAGGVTRRANTKMMPTAFSETTAVIPTKTGSKYCIKRTGIPEAADTVASYDV